MESKTELILLTSGGNRGGADPVIGTGSLLQVQNCQLFFSKMTLEIRIMQNDLPSEFRFMTTGLSRRAAAGSAAPGRRPANCHHHDSGHWNNKFVRSPPFTRRRYPKRPSHVAAAAAAAAGPGRPGPGTRKLRLVTVTVTIIRVD